MPEQGVTPEVRTFPLRRLAAGFLIGVTGLTGLAGSAFARATKHESKPKLVLQEQGPAFQINNGTVSVLKKKGVDVEGTPLAYSGIKKEATIVSRLGAQNHVFNLRIGKANDHLDLPVRFKNNTAKFHGFVILENSSEVAGFAGYTGTAPPALTAIDQQKNERVTYITPLPDQTFSNFPKDIVPNNYNLDVETCNNIGDVEATKKAKATLLDLYKGDQAKLKTALRVIYRIGLEAVCNSNALASATHQTGLSYSRYKQIASHRSLRKEITQGLPVPYIVLPQKLWKQL
jgi:hypothetical protein